MNYIYESVSVSYSIWTGKSGDDYLEIINKRGKDGWRFVCFAPTLANPKGVKGLELVFEKVLEDL